MTSTWSMPGIRGDGPVAGVERHAFGGAAARDAQRKLHQAVARRQAGLTPPGITARRGKNGVADGSDHLLPGNATSGGQTPQPARGVPVQGRSPSEAEPARLAVIGGPP